VTGVPKGCRDVQPGRRHGRVRKMGSPMMSRELRGEILERRETNNVSNQEHRGTQSDSLILTGKPTKTMPKMMV
jgi:hypothetical protein